MSTCILIENTLATTAENHHKLANGVALLELKI